MPERFRGEFLSNGALYKIFYLNPFLPDLRADSTFDRCLFARHSSAFECRSFVGRWSSCVHAFMVATVDCGRQTVSVTRCRLLAICFPIGFVGGRTGVKRFDS